MNSSKLCALCPRHGSAATTWPGLGNEDRGCGLYLEPARRTCMRIIAGQFRSRQLKSLKNLKIRPTSDMLRETLFNILGQRVEGTCVLDLFAGTGAVGIEAVSRGAAHVVLVENHRPTAKLITQNLALLEITACARVIVSDA